MRCSIPTEKRGPVKAALYTIDPRSPYFALYTPKYSRFLFFFEMRLNACFNKMAPFRSFAALLKGCSSYGRNGGQPQREMASPQGMKVCAVERRSLPEDFVYFPALWECNRRHSYFLRIFRSFGVRCSVRHRGRHCA